MAVWRFDVQLRIPWVNGPQTYYYWTNIYYADIRDFDDFDSARDDVLNITSRMSNHEVRLDWLRVTVLSTGAVIQNTSASWPANTLLVGPYAAVENTVYASLTVGGRQVSYKRWRSPVRTEDQENGRLTFDAWLYYQETSDLLVAPGRRFCTQQGEFFTGTSVSPLVHDWQMRHGTLRARRRRLH